jgi:prepilin-type N-terminal cleavage/methylation domain-containing protein
MNKLNSKASKAFSLIELSIVILIIGIIVAGITQSSRLVTQSKLKSAQNLTSSSPVAGIKSVALWLEPTLDASFPFPLDDEAFVTQWNDTNPQTPSKLYAIPASASSSLNIAYDSNGINGLPSIKFAGTASTAGVLTVSTTPVSTVAPLFTETPVITVDDPKNANAFTAFIVYNLDSTVGTPPIYTLLYNGVSGTTGWGYHRSAAATRTVAIATTTTQTTTTTLATARAEIATITFSGNTSKNTKLYINGGNGFITSSITDPGAAIVTPATRMTIGGSTTSTLPWKGLISEIIIFDSVLKNQDLKDVASYLSKKYGISLQ